MEIAITLGTERDSPSTNIGTEYWRSSAEKKDPSAFLMLERKRRFGRYETRKVHLQETRPLVLRTPYGY